MNTQNKNSKNLKNLIITLKSMNQHNNNKFETQLTMIFHCNRHLERG